MSALSAAFIAASRSSILSVEGRTSESSAAMESSAASGAESASEKCRFHPRVMTCGARGKRTDEKDCNDVLSFHGLGKDTEVWEYIKIKCASCNFSGFLVGSRISGNFTVKIIQA